jgi:hypothetical protein
MVWNIGPVNEYESQSAIIPSVGIIIPKKLCAAITIPLHFY